MTKKKIKILTLISGFIVLYMIVGIWIGQDVNKIMKLGMQNNSDYTAYMTDEVFKKLNPLQRGLTLRYDMEYEPEHHTYGTVIPIHFFIYSTAKTTHKFDNTVTGWNEPISFKLKLSKGKWKAIGVYIAP